MAKTRGADANDFRVSARTGFLPMKDGVRSTQVLDDVIEQINKEPETLLTREEARKALRISDGPAQIKPGEVIKMILGSEIVKVDHALVITKLREEVRRRLRAAVGAIGDVKGLVAQLRRPGATKSDNELAALLTEFDPDMQKQAASGTKAGSARSLFETMGAVAQCRLAGAIIKEQGAETARLLEPDVMGKGTGYTKCWLCGGLLLSKEEGEREPASPECEHILPALSAAMLRGLFTQGATAKAGVGSVMKGKVDDVNTFVKMTANNYLWAHQICNAQAKGAKFLIDYDRTLDSFIASADKIKKLAQEIAMRVGQRNPWCLYGGTAEWGKALGGGWGKKLKNLWSSGISKDAPTRLPNEFATHVRDILGYHWTGGFTNAPKVHCGDRTGKAHVPTAMAGTTEPVTCYTAYNGSAFWYKNDEDKYVIDIMLPKNRMAGAQKKLAELNKNSKVKASIYEIKYNGKTVNGSESNKPASFGWKACYDALMIEYTYHAEQIQKEYLKVKAKVKTDPGLKGEKDASFKVFASYCLEMGRLYFLSKKGEAIGLLWKEMKYQGGGRHRRGGVGEEVEPAVVNKEHAAELTKAFNDAAKEEARVAREEAKQKIPRCFPIIFATQLYYTKVWSNIDYDILEMTNVTQKGGGGHIQKGGNKTIHPSQIINFFTYLLLGNNTDRTLAVMNVIADSELLANLWYPATVRGEKTQLPEPVVAVTCQIMAWIFIFKKYGPQCLKKYNPSKKNSAIGMEEGLVKQNAMKAVTAQENDTPFGLKSESGYSGQNDPAFIDQICCLLNSAFRFIEASNLEGRRPTRSNYGKVPRNAALEVMGCGPNLKMEECLQRCNKNVNDTAVGKTLYYKAIMTKIRETIGWFSDSPLTRADTGAGTILGNIRKCLKRYYCDEKWVEFGLDKPCKAATKITPSGGYKRTKKKRRRRHTRRRRRRRKRKTRHRKKRRRRKRRTRR